MSAPLKRNEELVLDDSIKVNKKGEAILGVLEGPCADVINPTRNDRQYDEELWENVFKDPIVNEYFECGGLLGELDHPTDRTETDTSKVAICMPEKPKRGKDGKLYARFDILDTPNGRIAYTLAKYGYKLGVSSRGNGDVYEAFDGKEHVDSNTYELKAFDLVLLPAVKAARLALKESVGNKTFKQAIRESLESATKDEKRIMVESLRNLKIDYKMEQAKQSVKSDNKVTESVVPQTEKVAEDNGMILVEELQREILKNKELTESYQAVQEQLSVCYAKEAKYQEEIEMLKANQISTDKDKVTALESEISSLTERLHETTEQLNATSKRYAKLSEAVRKEKAEKKAINESLESEKDHKIQKLTEKLTLERRESEKTQKSLTEQIEDLKKNSAIKAKEYSEKTQKSNKLVEHYKKIAQEAVSRYIDSKALTLGISATEIKNRLTEDCTFDDVDEICESLQGYQIKLSKLPISIDSNKRVKVKVTESKEPIKPKTWVDDEIDDSLLRLAGLDKLDL